MTADQHPAHQALARAAGADTVLVKPCLPDRLIAEIRRVFDRSHDPLTPAAALSKSIEEIDRARDLMAQAGTAQGRLRQTLSHTRQPVAAVARPFQAPALRCPSCDEPLIHERSFVGGVNDRSMEQWDYFKCADGCGAFQYRHRTKKLRRLEE